MLLSKVKPNEQTKDFPGEYTKYRPIHFDSVKNTKCLSQNTVFHLKNLFYKVRGKCEIKMTFFKQNIL